MAFHKRKLLLLYLFLTVSAELGAACSGGRRDARAVGRGEGEEEKAERLPRSVVVVVTPLGRDEQRLMGAAMPARQRLAACAKERNPRWIHARRECDCPMAVDHTLRQLARWAREAHGMPTAVITALNPTNATAEPIVLTMSLPEEDIATDLPRSDLDLMQSESDFLEIKTGKRKLLWDSFSSKGEDDIENDIFSIQNEDDIVDSTDKTLNNKGSDLKTSPDSENFPQIVSTENNNYLEWAKDMFDLSPEQKVESNIHWDEKTSTREESSTSQNEMKHNGDYAHHDEKCSHGKCSHGTCKDCGNTHDIGSHGSIEGKTLSTAPTVVGQENMHDLNRQLDSSKDVQHLLFRQWLHAVEPSLAMLSRFRLGLPLEQPLRPRDGLPFEMAALPNPEDPHPHVHVGLHLVDTQPAESVLLAATRQALRTLDATSAQGPGSLFIVRSLAPVSGADLATLLGALGVPLADGAQPSEEPPVQPEEEEGELGSNLPEGKPPASDRLVVALDACPTKYEDALELFAHGPKAENLQHTTTLENFYQAIQDILSSNTTPRGEREELPADEVPFKRELFPQEKLHVRRLRTVPCAGRFCIQPLLQLRRHPTQESLLKRNRRIISSKATTVAASTPVTPNTKKRHADSDFWESEFESRRLRRGAALVSPHELSAAIRNPDETNKEKLGDIKFKREQEQLSTQGLEEATTQNELDEMEKSLEVAIEQLSKATNLTEQPEKHSTMFKGKGTEATEPIVSGNPLEKENGNTNKTVDQAEGKSDSKIIAIITTNETTITEKIKFLNTTSLNVSSTDEAQRRQAETESTIGESSAKLRDTTEAASSHGIAARHLTDEDLLREAEIREAKEWEDARVKYADGNTRVIGSPVAAFVITLLLLVVAH